MRGYYSTKLSGDRLQQCYELASNRVKQYLEAEIGFVVSRLRPTDSVLELGCGYGRVAFRLADVAARVVGIDTSVESLSLARRLAPSVSRCRFLQMDASALTFRDGAFDAIVCVQNGICAFAVDPERLMREALRVTRPGGRALFSTYSTAFWPERLLWFEAQAAAGLLGSIDYDQTGNGTVVCKDGFRAGMFSPDEFRSLCRKLGTEPIITPVDDSSVFCEIVVPSADKQRHATDEQISKPPIIKVSCAPLMPIAERLPTVGER
jgi:2-polyprenyl-6-hydroxyphenyl methylase/3-demethylubiquinone-9 3-methyltransferase